MTKSRKLLTFERTAGLFLDFEREYNELPHETLNSYLLEIRKEEFKTLWDKTRNCYEDFATKNNEVDLEEDIESANGLFKECRLGYISCAAQMGELSDSFFHKTSMSSTQCGRNLGETSGGQRHNLKLPPCITEVFKGIYQSWPSFRDMFKAVYIDGADLSGVEKLCYLRQFSEGDALLIVKESPLTNDGFQLAWENLRDRYENKRILVHDQLKVLFNLVPVKSESGVEIKKLQRDINNCISTLRVYKINIASWDPIFVYACLTKLPFHTLSLWEQTVKCKMEIPLWKDLDEFLTGRFQSLETISNIRSTDKIETNTNTDKSNYSRKRTTSIRVYQTQVSEKSCPMCLKNHPLNNCRKFLNKDQAGRFLFVKTRKLCINCLNEGHMLSECKSNSSCSKCYLKHHTLLHKEVNTSVPESTNRNNDDTPSVSGNNTTVQSCFATTSKHILLGTAIINIVSRGDVFSARAIIDPGSQTSFISQKLQNRLNLPTRATNVCISALNDSTPGPALRECDLTLGSPIDRDFKLNMSVFVLPKLTGNLPSETIDVSNLNFSLDFQLADPNFSTSGSVDILIGADFYPKIMSDGSRQKVIGDIIAHESHFGWILFGPVPSNRSKSNVRTFFSKISSNKHMENRLEHFKSPEVHRTSQKDKNIVNNNRRQKVIASENCSRWRKNCIKNIQQHNRFVHKNLKVNDMVLYRDDNFSISKWNLGHVIKIYIGQDGHISIVELKTDIGLTTIPVEKLVVLPTH